MSAITFATRKLDANYRGDQVHQLSTRVFPIMIHCCLMQVQVLGVQQLTSVWRNNPPDVKRAKPTNSTVTMINCHYCGKLGHKPNDCRQKNEKLR